MLILDEQVQKELYTYSRGISPLRNVAEDQEMIAALHADIPGGGGFGREVIRKIMSTAFVAPRFDGYEQALIMAESAVADELNNEQNRGNGVAAQREINLFLSKF